MAEYFDRDALLEKLANSSETWAKNIENIRNWWPHAVRIKDNIVAEIKRQPPADVEEVKHGLWIEQTLSGEATWCCSECKTLGSPHWKRCPVCEAKMYGGKEND